MSTTPSTEPTPQPPTYDQPAPYIAQPESGSFGTQYVYPEQAPTATTVKDTNTYALVSILLAFVAPLAGIIFGHMALNQIKRTGDAGRGLALTAVIYGYCMFALGLLFVIMYIGFIALAFSSFSQSAAYFS